MNLASELYVCAVDKHGYPFTHRLPSGLSGAVLAELALQGPDPGER